MKKKPTSIDDYLASVEDDDKRAALAMLRATIRAVAPGAAECISYGMPAFRLDGVVVAGFLATSGGCSYYPFSGTTLARLADDVRAYSRTKSALHFTATRPLSKALVKKLIATRVTESINASATSRAKASRGGRSAGR